ncbi:MAG: glycosyltransferase [Melioribacteraceae bacterium]|nr:glycosyltransferase [Bacteroidales bacterium]MCF8298705.1 glycosyltransferase [Saprospiraceae bacterium]MCF8395953.1 glycosyltransferase [Melioribacteraceae bacterium]
MGYPKILFVNINFRYDSSAGITIAKLVDHITVEKLFLLSTNANNSDIDIFNKKMQFGNTPNSKQDEKTKKSFLRKKIVSIIGQKAIFNKLKLDNDTKNWLDKINPDYIYFVPSNLEGINLVFQIAEHIKAKIIIHVLDDKVNVKFPGVLGFFYKLRFRKAFREIVEKSTIRLCISVLMAQEYQQRYGEQFVAFHNPVDIEKWIPFQKKNIKSKKNVTIIYSGAVESTAKPIIEFCEVIRELNGTIFDVKFKLYAKFDSIVTKQKVSSYDFVEIYNYVTQEELPATISKADFLFLPLSFEKKMSYVNLSMPTKTSEYMASGVPIIVYAPLQTALAQYGKKYEWGYIITTNKKNSVKDKLLEFLKDIDKQRNYSQRSMSLVKERHNVVKNKKIFDVLLNEKIVKSNSSLNFN